MRAGATTAAGMSRTRYSLFPTAIGTCAIAWNDAGICGVQLPGRTEAATIARLRRADATQDAPPPAIRSTILDIQALLDGSARDLQHAVLDLSAVPEFHRRVFEVVRGIPPGRTLSYGEVAARCDAPHAARAVGQAMALNPFPIIVPCHRVLAAHGRSGGFSAPGGVTTKLRLLSIVGAAAAGPASLL